MTVFELHIQVNQRLQEVASFKRDKYKPEEIDIALNKAMFRLLEKGVETRFQDDQINLGHVSALIKKSKTEEVVIPSTSDPLYEDNTLNGYSIVPSDLYWTINSRAEVLTDPVNCDTAPSLATTSKIEYVTVVSFPGVGSAPYYSNPSVTEPTLGTLYSLVLTGFNSINSKYVVVNNIVEYFYRTNPNIQVYWERYRDTYYKDSFVFVSKVPTTSITVIAGGQSSTGTTVVNTYSIYNRGLISALTNKDVTISSVTIQEEDLLYEKNTNRYYLPKKNRVLVDQTQDYFIIYRAESFIVTRFYFDYIRKPRTISLALNQSCELADKTHPKIVDFAVEILRLDTKDQAYPATVQDTQLRTN